MTEPLVVKVHVTNENLDDLSTVLFTVPGQWGPGDVLDLFLRVRRWNGKVVKAKEEKDGG